MSGATNTLIAIKAPMSVEVANGLFINVRNFVADLAGVHSRDVATSQQFAPGWLDCEEFRTDPDQARLPISVRVVYGGFTSSGAAPGSGILPQGTTALVMLHSSDSRPGAHAAIRRTLEGWLKQSGTTYQTSYDGWPWASDGTEPAPFSASDITPDMINRYLYATGTNDQARARAVVHDLLRCAANTMPVFRVLRERPVRLVDAQTGRELGLAVTPRTFRPGDQLVVHRPDREITVTIVSIEPDPPTRPGDVHVAAVVRVRVPDEERTYATFTRTNERKEP